MNTAQQQLQEAVRQVSEARLALALQRQQLAERQATFDEENADLIAAKVAANQRVVETEATCRAIALAHFQMTGEKKPTPGVEVKETKKYDIDEAAGFAWATEKGMCLIPAALDVKAIKKLATVQALPFVTVTTEPQVQLAGDLGAAVTSIAA